MSFDAIAGNVIAAFIYACLAYVFKKAFKALTQSKKSKPPAKEASKASLHKSFLVSLFLFLITLVVFCSIGHPTTLFIGSIKIMCGLMAGLSFLTTWGAFDAAFAFYPEDEVISEPSESNPDNDR